MWLIDGDESEDSDDGAVMKAVHDVNNKVIRQTTFSSDVPSAYLGMQ